MKGLAVFLCLLASTIVSHSEGKLLFTSEGADVYAKVS